jgi:hypothetical protein
MNAPPSETGAIKSNPHNEDLRAATHAKFAAAILLGIMGRNKIIKNLHATGSQLQEIKLVVGDEK